jgi:hypothetical protein
MAIRRFREHVAEQNWFAVLIDVGIVVLGVFLGTQVNNWNQGRIEAEQVRDYRARLADELDFNARQFATQARYYRQAQDYGKEALADLEGKAPLADRDFLIAAYQLSQTDTNHAKTYIYDELTANGLVGRLGSARLQEMASDYYLGLDASNRVIEETYPYRTLVREVMPYPVQKAIRSTCGDRLLVYRGRQIGVAVRIPCPVDLDPAAAAAAARVVRSTPGIAKEMTRYIASLDEKRDQLEPGVRYSNDLRHAVLAESGIDSP